MEQRWNMRFAARRNIGIEYPGGRTVTGSLRDVSLGGLFVELDTAGLPPHSLVRLRLAVSDGEPAGCLHLTAAVTRRTPEGIGLLYFGDVDQLLKYAGARLETIPQSGTAGPITRKSPRVVRAAGPEVALPG